jgi:uncharacterized membrane protein YbhN (UPF0104 family)
MDHQDGDTKLLEVLQREAFEYFLHETNPANGLVRDKTCEGWPASIAAVGLALTAYPVGVERAFLTREEAVKRTLTTLRFFAHFMLSTLSRTLGVIPGGLGVFEAVSVATLKLIGVPVAAGLAATLLFRFFTFWLPMAPGLILARRETRA